ncbi:MAG: dihydrodipicolinate synthase family protein [Planctomycetaceae bacterium]|nr:dihydrodipicolinate synthase family protein [Planctomycetaceae bacterium]
MQRVKQSTLKRELQQKQILSETNMTTSAANTFSISGIIPLVVTPLLDRDTLDVPGAKRVIEHILAGGASGLFILGSTGEAPSLSYRLRRQYIELVCEIVDQRVPVLVGITDTSFVESVTLAKFAQQAGANAVVLSTPYYFPAGQTELTQYVSRIVEELPLPLMLYNMPSLTKVWFEVESLEKLTEHKNIVGVKDSSGDLDYFKRVVELKQQRPDWSVLIGPEHLLLESLKLGGDGGVAGGANPYPKIFVKCYEAYRQGNEEKAAQYLKCIEALQEIYSVGKYASRHIKATKCALSLRGICEDKMAEPFNHFLPPEREKVSQILQKLDAQIEPLV